MNGRIKTGFLPFLSDHGPIKRAISMVGIELSMDMYMLISEALVSTASFFSGYEVILEHTVTLNPRSLQHKIIWSF